MAAATDPALNDRAIWCGQATDSGRHRAITTTGTGKARRVPGDPKYNLVIKCEKLSSGWAPCLFTS